MKELGIITTGEPLPKPELKLSEAGGIVPPVPPTRNSSGEGEPPSRRRRPQGGEPIEPADSELFWALYHIQPGEDPVFEKIVGDVGEKNNIFDQAPSPTEAGQRRFMASARAQGLLPQQTLAERIKEKVFG